MIVHLALLAGTAAFQLPFNLERVTWFMPILGMDLGVVKPSALHRDNS